MSPSDGELPEEEVLGVRIDSDLIVGLDICLVIVVGECTGNR
jgi:hypothetical protein